MILETVVLQQDLFHCYGCHNTAEARGRPGIHGFSPQSEEAYINQALSIACGSAGFNSNHYWDPSTCSMGPNAKECDTNSSTSQENCTAGCDGFFSTRGFSPAAEAPLVATAGRRKRKRCSRNVKNHEEVEHQRMTHINVERNRRKQMNDYLAEIRSMMPSNYIQRGDQASIVGGAINFVKQLEQLLQSLEVTKRTKKESSDTTHVSSLFSEFFTFPQYSTRSSSPTNDDDDANYQSMAKKQSTFTEVEVTMIETHANLKILSRKHPKELLKMLAGLYSLCLNILHLTVTTVGQMVLYSISVKVEDECQMSSVNEIAAAVFEMVGRIQEESTSNPLSCDN